MKYYHSGYQACFLSLTQILCDYFIYTLICQRVGFGARRLRIQAKVGIGFHPYFHVGFFHIFPFNNKYSIRLARGFRLLDAPARVEIHAHRIFCL